MIGPVTDIFEVTGYQAVDWYLPATSSEIAAQLQWPVKRVESHLQTLKRKGWAKRTDRLVPNGANGRGPKHSPIWVPV